MVDLLLICAFYDQEMFIAYLLYMRPHCRNHAHLVCIEHDTNFADCQIARRYANLEVRLALIIMVIKYEDMLLCFQSLIPFCFRLKEFRWGCGVSCKYVNDEERGVVARERQRLCCVVVALERLHVMGPNMRKHGVWLILLNDYWKMWNNMWKCVLLKQSRLIKLD